MKEKLVIIDAYSIIYKCFYGVRPMHSPKGEPTNAIYGFFNILLKLIEEENPTYLYAAFDKGKKTFRHSIFKEYKAGRESMPEDLRCQVPYIETLLNAANVTLLEKENYEADDIIGSVSKIASKQDISVTIITGDRDSFQLATDNTRILYSKRGISDVTVIDDAYLKEEYDLDGQGMIDLKALMGDKSDNIPGVAGVGEKTALNLLHEYKTLDNIYENIDNIKGKLKEKLIKDKDNAYLSKELGRIKTDMDIPLDLEDKHIFTFKSDEFVKILSELDLKGIIKKLGVKKISTSNEESIKEHSVLSLKEDFLLEGKDISVENIISNINKKEFISVYFNIKDNNVNKCSICDGNKFYVISELEKINEVISKAKGQIITHNFKDTFKIFVQNGYKDIRCDFDVYLGGYILNPSDERYSLEVLSKKYLDYDIKPQEKSDEQGSLFDLIGSDDNLIEDVRKSKAIYALYTIFIDKIKEEKMIELYRDIEHKLMYVLSDMEIEGFKVDINMLKSLGEDFNKQIEALTKKIREYADEGEDFNINSPKQLGVILFEKLKLPVIKKTKTGYSTNIEVLEKLTDHHPIIPAIIELRQVSKLYSTYVKGLIKIVDKDTNKIHSTFNQTITTTGRISSSNPNLQNIPVRTKEGRVIRKVFIASKEDNVLVDADYSQIELRVLAHISKDEKLINSFKVDEDIHTRTASEVFDVDIKDVTPSMRRRAKAVNFGIVYGISEFGLSKDLNISRKDAKEYIDKYLYKYPGVTKYMTEIVEYAKENGYVKTMFNRRRYINEIYSKNFNVRSFGERTALNTPIQGSAADIIKLAMINVERELKNRKLKAKLILQVHDELIIDTPKEEVEEVKELLKNEMENAVKMDCPLKADISIGKSWYEAK